MDSILLFSGGKESIYQLHHKQNEIGKLLFFNYGQKGFSAELKSLEYYSKLYGKEYQVIDLPFFILPPAIKDGIDCNPYVPQRNLVFISVALSIAESTGYKKVYLGAVADATEYDACPFFVDDINWALRFNDVSVKSFSRRYDTQQIIRSLVKNKVDISHLWSCDNPTGTDKFCGTCAKCTSALHNLRELYSDDKLVRKYYNLKYQPEQITKFLNNEFGQEQSVCSRPEKG